MDSHPNTHPPLNRTDILLAIFIGILALALYIRTLAPSLLWGDSAEFQTLSYTLGMTHHTGYATQIIFGKLFTLIPVNNIAYRVNMMSAFFGALAVANTFLIVQLLGNSRVAAASASLLLMLTEGFWWRALVAESYAPASGMLATVWLCFLLWRKTGKSFWLFIAGLVGAISIGIHSTVVMTASSVLIVMALTARKRSEWIQAATGAVAGVALFLGFFFFLEYNAPPTSVHEVVFRHNLSAVNLTESQYDTAFERFQFIFPAGHFWEYYFTATPEEINRRLVEYVGYFPAWVLALILLGAVSLFFNGKWRDGLYPLVAFLVVWGFAVTVVFSVYREFYVPVTVITSVWFGVGAAAALSAMERLLKQNQLWGRWTRVLIVGMLIVLPFWHAREDLRLAIREGHTTFVKQNHIYPIYAPHKAIQDANKLLKRIEPNAIVLAEWDKLYSYVYTAHIEGDRQDVSFHEAWLGERQELSETMIAYLNANIETRPIYFAVEMPGAEEFFTVTQIDENLFRVTKK